MFVHKNTSIVISVFIFLMHNVELAGELQSPCEMAGQAINMAFIKGTLNSFSVVT